jgi:hypothetical protein
MSRVDQYQVHLVAVAGRDCGLWQTFGGGGVDSEESVTRDAYGLPVVQLGGQARVQNFTMTRTYRVGRDPDLYPLLRKACGRAHFNAGVQLLDLDGFPVGPVEPYTGVLKSASKADVNIEGNEAMKVTLEFSAEGAP